MSDVFTRHAEARQSEPARPDQVPNNAGGYTFKLDDHKRLNRFLTIGTEGGTYYVGERALTRDNAAVVTRMAAHGDPFLVSHAVMVSHDGRAPSNDPALFALAAAAGAQPGPHLSREAAEAYRANALNWLPQVARTGTHLLHFVKYAELFRGWGPQLVRGIQDWYLGQSAEDLAYQLLKYKNRDMWAQRDVLRLSARKTRFRELPPAHRDLFAYVMKGTVGENLPPVVYDAAKAHATRDVVEWVRLIEGNRSLSWEMLPSEALAHAEVWRTMTDNGNLPLGALLRNLGRMTANGAIGQMPGGFERMISNRLTSPEQLKKARVHPVSVLLAMRAYATGRGQKGKATWQPASLVTDALNEAFYAAFGAVEPSGKRTLVALDVSGSMGWTDYTPAHRELYQRTGLVPREVVAAMSMVTARTEPAYLVTAFSHEMVQLNISPSQRLDNVVDTMSRVPMGGTDAALPMLWAAQNKVEVDTFQLWTDNETWAGRVHPHRALEQYRQAMGIDARLQVCAAVATQHTVADPLDPRQLDTSGFDAAVPRLLADHARGSI